MTDSEHLLSLAGAVADGEPVAWEEASRAADGQDVPTVAALRDLQAMLTALRQIDAGYEKTASTLGPSDDHEQTPEQWGHLTILGKVGKGSFGTVYTAHDSRLGIDVALKLLATASARPGQGDRILREARLIARVRHPNVVRVYGVDETQERAGLWMELVKGRSLEDLLRAQGPFSAEEASLIGRDVCRAMAAVHKAGVLHGDIKAHNVMREAGGRTVLMDFGAGQAMSDADGGRNVRLAGTPAYLSPEVLDGEPRSASSDIYAVGVLLYHLVTGSYPLMAPSVSDLVEAHKQGKRRHVRDARPDLPDDFVRIVEQATATEPSRRFASFGALEEALARVTSPTAGSGDQEPGFATQLRRSLRTWMLLPVAAAALAALFATGRPARSGSSGAQSTAPPAAIVQADPGSAAAGAANNAYEVEAAFYKAGSGGDQRLESDARVAPGDELFLKVQASVPLNVYVVNEDEKGAAFLLYPLPGQRLTNPLPAGRLVTLPGSTRWQVTSAGEREHFLVFASPGPLESLEQAFAALPPAKEGAPITSAGLPAATLERLRAVGGLTPAPPEKVGGGLSRLFTSPLTNARETTRGLWVRQITLDNPSLERSGGRQR